MKAKRVFIIVLDSVGIGYAPDAADFGDAGVTEGLCTEKIRKILKKTAHICAFRCFSLVSGD